jgi:hypothetical protein
MKKGITKATECKGAIAVDFTEIPEGRAVQCVSSFVGSGLSQPALRSSFVAAHFFFSTRK